MKILMEMVSLVKRLMPGGVAERGVPVFRKRLMAWSPVLLMAAMGAVYVACDDEPAVGEDDDDAADDDDDSADDDDAADDDDDSAGELPAGSVGLQEDIFPIIKSECMSCHSADGEREKPYLETLDDVMDERGEVASEVIRGSMPTEDALPEEQIRLFERWKADGYPETRAE